MTQVNETQNQVYERWIKQFPLCFETPGCCMGFGLEFNKGWNGIVEELLGKIEAYLAETYKTKGKPEYSFQIDQIKEKFGTLRFYVTFADDAIFDMINDAECKSAKTCEHCGNTGEMKTRKGAFWLQTQCEKCAEKYDYVKYDKNEFGV